METTFDLISSLSHESVQLAINGIWLGLALVGVAWLLLRYARGTAAATKYTIWWAALAITVALPILLVGGWQDQPVNGRMDSRNLEAINPWPAVVRKNIPVDPKAAVPVPDRSPAVSVPEVDYPSAPVATPEPIGSGSLALRLIPVSLGVIWLAGMVIMIGRLRRAYRNVIRIKNNSAPFDYSHLPRIGKLLDRRVRRSIEVALSHDIHSPIAAGLGRPMILIPHQVVEALSDEELESVIMHELAHLIRWDDWTKLAQKLLEAVLFFHPAIHIIGGQLELERELACDEWAVAQTGPVDLYARCLTRLVQLTTGSATTLIPGVLNNRKQVFRRFERLLLHNPADHSGGHKRYRLIGLSVVVTLAIIAATQVVPAINLPFSAVTFAELGISKSESGSSSESASEGRVVRSARESASASASASASSSARTVGTAYVVDDKVYGSTIRQSGRTITTRYIDDDLEVSAEVRGRFELADDNRSLEDLSDNGYFIFIKEENSETREVEIEVGDDGDLTYSYMHNGRDQDFDRDARKWFADALEDFVAETGFGANERLRRLIAEGGLLAAMQFVRNGVDHDLQRYYYEELMNLDHLGKQDVRRIRDRALEDLTDEYDRETIRDLATSRLREIQTGRAKSRGRDRSIERERSRSSERSGIGSNEDSFAETSFSVSIDDEDRLTPLAGSSSNMTHNAPGTVASLLIDAKTQDRNLSDRVTFDGEWEAEFKRGRPWLYIAWFDGRNSQSQFSVPLEELVGVDEAWRTETANDISFLFPRDAGVFEFAGDFRRGEGWGDFEFRVDEDYIQDLQEMGYLERRLPDRKLYQLALFDVSREFIREMERLGYKGLSLDKLIEMRIHRVDSKKVEEFQSMGYDLSADRLVEFQIHGVDPWYVKELAEIGLENLPASRLVEFQIHGVEPEDVREFAETGLENLSAERLVEFRIHDVTPGFVKELAELGYDKLPPSRLVEFRIHGVSPSFIRDLADKGYDDLSAERLVEFRIHGVNSGGDLDDFAEFGLDRLSPDRLVQFRIHGVSPSFVKEISELGYDHLSADDLIQFRIHGVSASFIKGFADIGYDDLSADRLVEFRIHGVSSSFVKQIADLGFDDVDSDQLVSMKIHGVSPSYIKRVQKKGFRDLTIDDLIDMRIYGVF